MKSSTKNGASHNLSKLHHDFRTIPKLDLENDILDVSLCFHFIDNCFASAGHAKVALGVRINSSKNEMNQKYTRTNGRETNLVYEEQQRGYRKCLQHGCIF